MGKSRNSSIFLKLQKKSNGSPKLKSEHTKIFMQNLDYYQNIKKKENFFSIGKFGFIKLLMKIKKIYLTMKEKLFLKAEKQIFKEMDIVQILKKLQEIEKLKLVLLNEDQLYFFNLLSKPMINLDENELEEDSAKLKDRRFKFSMKEELPLRKDKLIENYQKMKFKTNISEIDKRIIKLLDEDVASFINNA